MKHFVLSSTGIVLSVLLVVNMSSAQTCTGTGPYGSTTGANNSFVGSFGWGGLTNTATADGNDATASTLLGVLASANTYYLQITGFNFNVPTSNTICGVTASIVHQDATVLSLGGTISDNSLVLVKGSALVTGTGSNHAQSGAWPRGGGTANYGTSTDGWGSTWTPFDINNSGFGIALSASVNSGLAGLVIIAAVDQITVTVYSSPPSTLAIDLVNFTVQGGTGGNVLNWTASTTGSVGSFIVQRSADGTNWQDMTTIPAPLGQDAYSYTDVTPLSGENFYRLQLLNTDGSTQGYSVVATVAGRTMANVRTYPNPFTDMINITSPVNFSKVILRDALGRTLQVKEYGSGVNNAQINAAGFPAGLYFLQVDATTYKLIKN